MGKEEDLNMLGWLRGWKRIAAYCDCSVSTAKRLAYQKGMPVHLTDCGPVALPCQLDDWLISQSMNLA